MRLLLLLLLCAVAAQAVPVRSKHTTGLTQHAQTEKHDNPMESVPLVGSQFKTEGVSTALQCVISLTIQYMAVFTALAMVRTAGEAFGWKLEAVPLLGILETASVTVNYAPMLAVLFLACRMRATWITQGKGNPPDWVQMWMYCATYAVLAMTLVVCIIPLFTKEVIGVDQRTGDIDPDAEPFGNWYVALGFTVLKYLIMIGLYVGVICIIYGMVTFEPPKGTWPEDKIPPVSAAVGCTMILACTYFVIYAAVQLCKTGSQFTASPFVKTFQKAAMVAANAMNFAPMLSVLFIGARMRALQMDPVNGAPQAWAQNWFYACTYATVAQVLISIFVPIVMGGAVKVGKTEGDMEYTVENKTMGTVLSVARYVIMLCIYVGFSCIIYSVFTIQHPNGEEFTPPISVTMQCVINLTFQFFFTYLGIWACITVKEFASIDYPLLTNTMLSLVGTVMFCPMLAILFVGTRMRALSLTDNKGAPQGWVQDGMYMATWALLIQFVMCLIVPCATGEAAELDDDGNSKWEPTNKVMLYAVLAIKWLGFVLLYGGIIAVIVGAYTMTAETANGRGSVPLVGGYIGEPVGVNDIPGGPVSK